MRKFLTVIFVGVVIFINSISLKAQQDCFGLSSIFQNIVQSGVFGGYGIQKYSAAGLNDVIRNTTSLNENFNDFGTAWGWRAGANVFGFMSQDLIVTLKFYYQAVKESQEAQGTFQGEPATQKLKLDITNWNLGMSMSYVLGPNFDIRIFDVYLTWTNATFTDEINSINAPPIDEYTSPETHTGFTADAGFVWYPFPPYLAIEVLGGYSRFVVETVTSEQAGKFPANTDFIDGGGFFAMAVLTIGIPFN